MIRFASLSRASAWARPSRHAAPLARGLVTAALAASLGCAAGCSAGCSSGRATEALASATAPASASATADAVPTASVSATAEALPTASASAAPPPPTPAEVEAAEHGPAEQGCPSGMARIGRTCIDRWEAHLVLVGADGARAPHPHNLRPEPGARYEAHTRPGVFPQGYISRVEASAACKEAGKRLCGRGEWLRACRGGPGRKWPYGHGGRRGVCNNAKAHLLSMKHGDKGGRWKYDEHFNDPSLLIEPGFLAKAGEHEGCRTPEGVFDLVGNLHEWVDGKVDQDLVDKLADEPVERRKQPWREGNGIFLGGFFSNTDELGPGCTYITIAHEPSYHDYSTGFRCCKTAAGAEPKKVDPKKRR